jgi:hypothetical protein
MERMISSMAKSKFEILLRARQLADPVSSFSIPDFFDEVPLYARYAEVEFLKKFGNVDLLLVKLALDYLERVTSASRHSKARRFAAITVINDDEDEFIVPSVFVCNGSVSTRLRELHLSLPSKGLGKRIEALVKDAKLNGCYCVLEDRDTIPGDVRVFIGHKSPLPGFVSPKLFVKGKAHLSH